MWSWSRSIASLRRDGRDSGGLRLHIAVHLLGGVAAVADAPDDQRGAADDVAGGEDAVERAHHRAVVDLDRAPARHRELGRTEETRHVFGVEAQRLDD